MTLKDAKEGKEYFVASIDTDDKELLTFLLSLGCYAGSSITVVTQKKRGCILSIKDSRYAVDNALANIIKIEG